MLAISCDGIVCLFASTLWGARQSAHPYITSSVLFDIGGNSINKRNNSIFCIERSQYMREHHSHPNRCGVEVFSDRALKRHLYQKRRTRRKGQARCCDSYIRGGEILIMYLFDVRIPFMQQPSSSKAPLWNGESPHLLGFQALLSHPSPSSTHQSDRQACPHAH